VLFSSPEFAVFLPCAFLLYLLLSKHLRLQNAFLLIASYIFYGWWDTRFLLLIAVSTLVDFAAGIAMHRFPRGRRVAMGISLATNLGLLGVFKYFNFFIDSFQQLLTSIGIEQQAVTLNVILPVGISFYTFQTLSYTIDVYRGRIEPCKDFIAFAAFVSFFPQLVAGPIERAAHLLPQFHRSRVVTLEGIWLGARQILWGLFKKMVVADNLAGMVNTIFSEHQSQSGAVLAIGVLFFAFQIYCDFSGYSDIALGTSRIFGFDLCINFRYPYFSRDIAEFWRRWHISLSTWFRDYVYIPLGGSRGALRATARNVLITFVISGLWHGANWTFVVWGAINGLLFLPLFLSGKNRTNLDTVAQNTWLPSLSEAIRMLTTFLLVCIAWVFFRAETLGDAFAYLNGIVSRPWYVDFDLYASRFVLIGVLLITEWLGRNRSFPFAKRIAGRWVDLAVIAFFFWATVIWARTDHLEFIYFQF
jgi:D-alanyl-lipoteichoic acid acyltransferase DltB (MBOAT superfamily)